MPVLEVLPHSEEDWRIAVPPIWVEPCAPDWDFEAPEGSAVALLLVDEQRHVPSRSVSNRIVRLLLSPAAIQTFGQVEIPFDPQTRRLRIHELVVWRKDDFGIWKGRSLADTLEFGVRRDERQAGRISVVAAIDGLEVGDAIDFSWTLEPQGSTSELPFTNFHGFVWNVPCGVTHFTIHSGPGTPVKWRLHCPETVKQPEHETTPGREHWRQTRPPITRAEPDAPPGVWNYPVLEASCWRDWNEVAESTQAAWAEALASASGEVRDAMAHLSAGRELEESVTEVIRFVQDEVTSLESESPGLSPATAVTVLRRGSGDAKDKAALLTVLLRQLGVEACPLLVNPEWGETVASLLPSAAVFNHVIVTFVVDGQRHFADPTEASRKGNFHEWLPSTYGFGLEVKPGVTALLPLPPAPPAELILRETFHLNLEGEPSSIEQVLRATNWLADEMRESVAREGRSSFIHAHLEPLRHQFPTMRYSEEGVDLREDPAADAIELRGVYDLPSWGPPGERPPEFRYRANGLFLAVDWDEAPGLRTVARAMRHPLRVEHHVEVKSAGIRQAKPDKHVRTGPGFRYSREITSSQGRATIDHVWESTAPRIEASEWLEHCRARDDVFAQLETSVLTQPTRAPYFKVRSAVFFSLLAAGIVGGLGVWGMTKGWSPWQAKEGATADKVTPAPAPPPPEVQAEMKVALEAATQGDLTSAEPLLEKQQLQFQENPAFQFLRAEIAIRMGQLDRARKALDQAKALDPSNVNGDVLTALLQRAEGDRSGAQELLTESVERNPNDPRPLRELAITLAEQGDPKGACDAWAKVLALTPGDSNALRQYAVLLWQNNEKDRADAIIREALAAQSTPNATLEAAVADYYTLTGRRAEALNQLEKAASLAPGDRTRDFALASGHLRMGKTAEAAELATQLTRDFPTDVRAWQVLAVAKSILGDQPVAEAAYREWMRLAPQDPNGPANFGFFLHQTGRSREARDLLAKCTAQFPGEGMIWLNYGAVLEALGETEAAAAAKQKASGLLTNEEKQLLIK